MPRWIRRLLRRREGVCLERVVTPGQQEATAALNNITAVRREIQAQAPEAAELSNQLRVFRERNHFAEAMELLYRGGDPRWGGHS